MEVLQNTHRTGQEAVDLYHSQQKPLSFYSLVDNTRWAPTAVLG